MERPILELIVQPEGALRVLAGILLGFEAMMARISNILHSISVNTALPVAANNPVNNLRGYKIDQAANMLGLLPHTSELPPGTIELTLDDGPNTPSERWRTMTRIELADRVCRPLLAQTILTGQKMLEEIDSPGALSMQVEDMMAGIWQIMGSQDHLACFYAVLYLIVCGLLPSEMVGPPPLCWMAIGKWEHDGSSIRTDIDQVLSGKGEKNMPPIVEIAQRWLSRITQGVRQWHNMGCPC
jgi:hypothetical protein